MWVWLALAAIALILELVTGTFVLLLVGLGLAAAGGVAAVEGPLWLQILCLAVFMIAAWFVLKRLKRQSKKAATANPNVNLDIGKTVNVTQWHGHTCSVLFRGATWQAQLASNIELDEPPVGLYTIVEVKGITLILEPISSL